jgi:hypothetical protein
VSALAEIVLRQARGGISLVAVDHYGHKFTPALQATLPPDTAAGDELARFLPLLKALDFQAVFGGTGREAQLQAEIYRLFVGDSATADMLASGTSPPLAASAMLERRGRAVNRAQMAFKDEQERLGDEFAPERLEIRLFRYIAISEAAFLSARAIINSLHSGVSFRRAVLLGWCSSTMRPPGLWPMARRIAGVPPGRGGVYR